MGQRRGGRDPRDHGLTHNSAFRTYIHVSHPATLSEFLARDLQCGRERILSDDFRKAKVGELDGQVLISQQDVFWLDVSMYNVAIMLAQTG